ncbi:MAG: 3-methylornithine--L-lysine ligase PylC [Actinobacteria bacterium]|nr:3-methylornithine--L-lysine ligase PylC [Actinomycetota bacterium]
MRLAIVGGKLQGTEACYLAGKAAYQTVLVDRHPVVPAAGLASEFHVMDVVGEPERARTLFLGCDAVLPACEDGETLAWLDHHVRAWGVPLLFDWSAYRISSSKLRSNELFDELGVAHPRAWPACGFPLIVKPSGASGSEGVRLAWDELTLAAARAALEKAGHSVVVEEFSPGVSWSLEVIAWEGRATPLLATELEFDRFYDCKRVVAPVSGEDAAGLVMRFDDLGVRLAEGLRLQGLMDIEVVLHGGELKVLEIDARLPSQTPTAVFHCCGANMVRLLAETVLGGATPAMDRGVRCACCYQHVAVADGAVEVLGEHVMASARPLRLQPGRYGAFEVLGELEEDQAAESWSATIITRGDSPAQARAAAATAVARLAEEHGLAVTPESTAQPGDNCR